MTVLDPWVFLLLALAAFRVWRLLSVDEILSGPRKWVLGLGYRWMDGDPIPKKYREKWAIFFECPFCMGAWVSLAILGAYMAIDGWLGWFSFFVTWMALSASVGLIRGKLDPPED